MIHEILKLTRSLFVFDTETTGVDTNTARIIELGFQQWGPSGLVKEWRSLINPGIPIPEGAFKVHGISTKMIEACQTCHGARPTLMHFEDGLVCTCEHFRVAPMFKQIALNIARGFSDCDFAGKNVRFDLRILAAEMARAKVSWSYGGARIIDAERLEQIAIPRSLSHLYQKYEGKPLEGAHGALTDASASTTVIIHQLRGHPTHTEPLPHDIDELHEAQWPGFLDTEGRFRIRDGNPTCMFGKHAGTMMKDIPNDYWDWIIRSDFPADVKALAAKAKLGDFPEANSSRIANE